MSFKVFLSYAIKDAAIAELVKEKITELLPQSNVEPGDVFDVRFEVAAGEDIRQSIKSAMEVANTVVVISSESSDSSAWVNYEVGLADALGKELVVVEQKGASDSAIHRRLFESARMVRIEDG